MAEALEHRELVAKPVYEAFPPDEHVGIRFMMLPNRPEMIGIFSYESRIANTD